MASEMGMKLRTVAAQERTNAAIPRVAAAVGIEIPPIPTDRRDKVLEGALRAEWLADTLEAIAAAAEKQPTPINSKRAPKPAA